LQQTKIRISPYDASSPRPFLLLGMQRGKRSPNSPLVSSPTRWIPLQSLHQEFLSLVSAWEKGERLAKLIAHCRTLRVLDGPEPLQNPFGPQEGRLSEPTSNWRQAGAAPTPKKENDGIASPINLTQDKPRFISVWRSN
jgi:hypothetical protein